MNQTMKELIKILLAAICFLLGLYILFAELIALSGEHRLLTHSLLNLSLFVTFTIIGILLVVFSIKTIRSASGSSTG